MIHDITFLVSLFIVSVIVIPNVLVPLDHFLSGTHEWSPEARYRRKLRRELRIWTNILVSCDPECEPEDYAFAVRKVTMLRRELDRE